ncbi:MAG TPA: ATP-binding protein [Puia sp.]|nr:ATP-binding protein [Puia sp.]
MKKPAWLKTDARSLRLTGTYLLIMMIVSIAFSAALYAVTVSQLYITVGTQGVAFGRQAQVKTLTPASGAIVGQAQLPGGPPLIAGQGTVSYQQVNKQIADNLHNIRSSALMGLIFLNLAILIGGAILSYLLARLTLRPIESALTSQSRFTSDASHELRTPLAVMQTEIEVTLRSSNLDLARAKAALSNNLEEVVKLKQLSEGLLSLTSAVDTKAALASVDEAVTEAINQVMVLAQEKSIEIKDTVPKLGAAIDGPALTQVLVILLDNAIKYSPEGKSVTVTATAVGKQVAIKVTDHGYGIRATDLPHIFDRFFRADPSRSSRHVTGYGLGLAIAKNVLSRYHADLTVESKAGSGSVFTILLPAKPL